MSTACDDFKPHRWKPKQCAACFRPKAEHSQIKQDDSDQVNSSQSKTTKQSPFYKKFSFDENGVGQNTPSSSKEPTRTNQQPASPSIVSDSAKSQVPRTENQIEEEVKEQSPPQQVTAVESGSAGSVCDKQPPVNDHMDDHNSKGTKEAPSDNGGNTPPRPPPPRARSHTVAAPMIKPRKNIPEPLLLATTETLPRDPQPVPAPRRNRANRSASPNPSGSLDDTNVYSRAKSLDNLDVSSPSDRKVTFDLYTTTITNPSTNAAPVTTVSKTGMIQPYAVSEVSDILQRATKDNGIVAQDKEENDNHDYIEADQINAAVVSVSELKSKRRPSEITKYSTLSTLQPGRQQDKKQTPNGGVKQKAMSSGAITMRNTPRRHAPPPPGVARNRSATITSVRMQNYSAPRRPPPPAQCTSEYTNANVKRPVKNNEPHVAKVPPPKPTRTLSTFDYENLNGTVISSEAVEYSAIESDVFKPTTSGNSSLPRPKKPVRMPKEATPVSDGDQPPSQQPVIKDQQPAIKGKYVDLDMDQLAAGQVASREQTPLMKYENFDDFSPQQPISPELKSLGSFDALSALPLEGASQVNDAILNSLNVASVELTKFYFDEFSFMGKMVCSKWSDFDPASTAPPGMASCVKYNGKLLSLQVN